MPKKIVHVSSVHPATDPRIFRKECRSLVKAGYEVVLVVPHPPGDEVLEGVQIRSVPMPNGRKDRMLHTTKACWARALTERGDLYHFHDPELMPGALKLARGGHKVIYDAHEHLGEDLLVPTNKHYVPNWLRRPLSWAIQVYERYVGSHMAAVIPVVESHVGRFPAGKSVVLQNYPIGEEIPVATAPPYAQRDNLIAFTGGLTKDRCALEMVEAMGLLAPDLQAKFWVVGMLDSDELLTELSALPGWSRTEFGGYIRHNELYSKLVTCKIGLATMAPDKYEQDFSANKIYDYMMAGIPILASPNKTWIQTMDQYQCGLILKDGSAQALADGITELLNNPERAEEMGRAGRKAALENFTWEAEEKKLIELVHRLIGPP